MAGDGGLVAAQEVRNLPGGHVILLVPRLRQPKLLGRHLPEGHRCGTAGLGGAAERGHAERWAGKASVSEYARMQAPNTERTRLNAIVSRTYHFPDGG